MFLAPLFTWFRALRYCNFAHFSRGPITVYGAKPMQWAIFIKTKRWGYICFRLPVGCKPLYLYTSPNGLLQASTFYLGRNGAERKRARARRQKLGHNFDANWYWRELSDVNQLK